MYSRIQKKIFAVVAIILILGLVVGMLLPLFSGSY